MYHVLCKKTVVGVYTKPAQPVTGNEYHGKWHGPSPEGSDMIDIFIGGEWATYPSEWFTELPGQRVVCVDFKCVYCASQDLIKARKSKAHFCRGCGETLTRKELTKVGSSAKNI